MTTITAEKAQKKMNALLAEVDDSHEPVFITGKKKNGVLISEEDWRSIRETLYLCSIPGMRESIIKGGNTPVDKCFEEPGW